MVKNNINFHFSPEYQMTLWQNVGTVKATALRTVQFWKGEEFSLKNCTNYK